MTDSRPRLRRPAIWAATTALATAMLALAPTPAQAAPPTLLECLGTETTTYHPGLTFQPKDITITTDERLTSCVDGAGQVTGGWYGTQFTIHVGCNDLLDPFQDTRVFHWSTGDTSTFSESAATNAVAGQIITTLTGTVTAGRFQGHTTVRVTTLLQPSLLLCLTTGVTTATGVTTLTII
ncbi:hypothetical protein [Peterkaempfera bronchialis]|uniref:Uncharacterized protein n=1 Tax=Peterkaempfera bronchialis TaxID=2126346 RepID=A0A345SX95_9ACTN|nr:hypothetical protein [Peterkaempfera bronchialis]AXI78350.1 hypothetical protein C7M71_013800 [Peterkaempfera bronchialis]